MNNDDVKLLGFGNELYISESMCIENQQLFYRFHRLKALKKIHSCWFFNSYINVKVRDQSQIKKIFHGSNLEELLDIDNTDEFLNIKPRI